MKRLVPRRSLLLSSLFAALVVAVAVAETSSAAIISLSPNNGGTVMGTTEPAGAPGVRVDHWNNFDRNNQDLGDNESVLYDNGSVVGGGFLMDLTVNIGSTGNFADRTSGTNDRRMVAGVVDTYSSTSVALSNIPFDEYEIYIYMYDDGSTRSGGFTIGGTTYYARGGAGNPDSTGNGYVLSTDTTITAGVDSSVDQGNYVRFAGLTGSSQFITLFAADGSTSVERNKWGGIQIVQVPEPSTMAMWMGLTALGLLGCIRRRK